MRSRKAARHWEIPIERGSCWINWRKPNVTGPGHSRAPLMEKRRQVDTGSATVAELQIAYLQATPTPEQKQREEQPLVQLAGMMKNANTEAESSDSQAATLITFVTFGGLMIVILLSGSISWRVAKSITSPLSQLISVAGQIGNTGDLEQKVEIRGEDEVAQLARTFNNMVLYLREMAGISEAIAGGDLSVEINRARHAIRWARPSAK